MAFADTFTGAAGDLLDHTLDTGQSYKIADPYSPGELRVELTGAGKARPTTEMGNSYNPFLVDAMPDSADQEVEIDFTPNEFTETGCSVSARSNDGPNMGTYNHIYAGWQAIGSATHGKWFIGTFQGASDTTANVALTGGQTYRLKLRVVGSTAQLYVDDVLKLEQEVELLDNGLVGFSLECPGGLTKPLVDNFSYAAVGGAESAPGASVSVQATRRQGGSVITGRR